MSDLLEAGRVRAAALAGRRFDAEDFATSEVDRVQQRLGELLDEEGVTMLVCAAACGADLVALRLAKNKGWRWRIVLPFAVEAFRSRSVADRCDLSWSELFDELVNEARSANELVILDLAEDDADVFTKTNERILEIASSACRGDVPLAVVVWEGAPRVGADTTADFRTRAIAKDMQVEVVLTRPPTPSELRTETALSEAKRAKGNWLLARKILDEALASRDLSAREREQLTARRALSTYKDAGIPPYRALDEALRLLAPFVALSTNPETLGIAGAIQKRLWQVDARVEHLERSLGFYRKGHQCERALGWDQGYPGINAALILDILASIDRADSSGIAESEQRAVMRKAEAREIRKELLRALSGKAASPRADYWLLATVAEALFGLGEYARATPLLARAAELVNGGKVDGWELETTARQLAFIARLSEDQMEGSAAWEALKSLLGTKTEAVRAAFFGRVGLALSGGGFRASLFHIGVLARLAECHVLRHVEVLSCVSGGSIVGALYHLELQKALSKRSELEPKDYIDIVDSVSRRFLKGVQRNIRMRVLLSPLKNLQMIRKLRSRTEIAGTLYEKEFYALDGGRADFRMGGLNIKPVGARDFDPRHDNWHRSSKVPLLIINAATLNTGHSWQFTPTSMGEPAARPGEDIDCNERLLHVAYEDSPKFKDLTVGMAVAASACVPVLFEPIAIDGLYARRNVRLVDGGVHDNQGVSSLLDQGCSVLLVSDASGQLPSDATPSSSALAVGLRSDQVFQARLRETQFLDLSSRQRGKLLQGLMFLHLKLGVDAPAVTANADTPGARNEETAYGVSAAVQERLAALRTDLDVFSDVEALMLMQSGYLMTKWRLAQDIQIPGSPEPLSHQWCFAKASELMSVKASDDSRVSREVLRLLDAGQYTAFKVWRLSSCLKWTARVFGMLALGSAAWASWRFRDHSFTLGLGSVALALAVFALTAALPAVRPLLDMLNPRRKVWEWVFGVAAALVGSLLAAIHIVCFDRIFIRLGKVERVLNQR